MKSIIGKIIVPMDNSYAINKETGKDVNPAGWINKE